MRIRLRVKGNDFAFTKHRFRCVAVTAAAPHEYTFVPSLKQRASECPHARLRTVSGPLSCSIAFTEEFQVPPSMQRAWNAKMVCMCASVEIQARRVKSISDPTRCSPSAHHDMCLHPRDVFTSIARSDDDTEP